MSTDVVIGGFGLHGRRVPSRVTVEWHDPLDGRILCSASWPYQIRRGANGWYTTEIRRLTEGYRTLFSDILEGRTPLTKTTLTTPC